MPLSSQRSAYHDCAEIFARAIATHGGVRSFIGPREKDALYLQSRMNQYRAILRRDSTLAYKPGEPLYGTSEYDELKVVVKQDIEDHWWLYVEPQGNWDAVANLEPIPATEMATLPVYAPEPPQLPAPAMADGAGGDDLE